MNSRSNTALRALLMILLLAVQVLGYAHQLDHFVAGDTGTCAVCSVGSSLGHAAVNTTDVPVDPPTHFEAPVRDVPAPTLGHAEQRRARAPPLSR